MPTYQYRCGDCDAFLEVVQSFTDDALTTCEGCGGALRKVFSGVGVVFKGSGFYRTDSRTGGSGSTTAGSADSGSAPSVAPAKAESSSTGNSSSGGSSSSAATAAN
ncbi:MAG: hypothetical protein KGP01_03715 [Actinomycetales bacterium]|nr:hypothetical protein [Actinomycetales bacterium]